MVRFSIIIISRLRDSLYKTLESLEKVRGIDECEVILLYQETDKKADLESLKGYELNIALYREEIGKSYAFYRNTAVASSHGDLLIFLDDDVEVLDSNWLEEITKPILEEKAEVVMGRVIIEKSNYLGDSISLLGYPAGGNLGFRKMWRVDDNGYTSHISTCNTAILKSALSEVDGFTVPKELGKTQISGEDNILAHKLTAAGYRILYKDEPVVQHEARSSIKAFVKWHTFRGRSLFYVRNSVNQGLLKYRMNSYIRLFFRELPLRSFLIAALLIISVIAQSYGYYTEKYARAV